MQNRFIPACEALQPYIRQYIYIRADGSTDTMTPPEGSHHFVDGLHVEKVLPGIGSMCFVRGANVRFDTIEQQGPCLFICGPYTRTYDVVTLSGWFEALYIDFQPGGMRAVLGYDMASLRNTIVTPKTLNDLSLHECALRISQAHDIEECAPILDNFFLARLRPEYTRYEPIVTRVVAALDEARGALSAAGMASIACMSERQFRRIFSDYVGLSPKEFIRLRRFHMALQYMQSLAHTPANHPIDLMSIVVRFGYYDLSHLASEFRALGCTSPGQFFRLGIPIQPDFSIFFG